MNRIESTISTLQITKENSAAAKSRIVDADYAAETAKLAKHQILQKASISMLAQANSRPEMVLRLLTDL
jgi:flagellin